MSQQVDEIVEWLSEPQTAILSTRVSNTLNMAGQGSGKSEIIGYSSGMFVSEFPEVLGFIGANTYLQLSQSTLVRVFDNWRRCFGFTEYDVKSNRGGTFVVDKKPPAHFERRVYLRDYSGTISFYNGALIYLGSLDNYKAHDGKQFGWAHLDETKDTKEEALKEVILGRLRQPGLWTNPETGDISYNLKLDAIDAELQGLKGWNPLYIHTSPAPGGVDWLNKMFKLETFADEIKTRVMRGEADYFYKEFENKAVCIYSVHHNAPNLPPNYIENQIANLADEDKVLKLVYGYPFSKSGGEWYINFRRDKHVGHYPFRPGETGQLTFDFNVVPFMTLLCAQIDYVTRYVDEVGNKHAEPFVGAKALDVMRIIIYKEYCLESPYNTTEAVCEHWAAEYGLQTPDIMYYGDPSGLSRIPGLGSQTNFKIVEESLAFHTHNSSKQVKQPAIAVFTRRDFMNKLWAGKIPTVELYINGEECPELVEDCEHVKQGPKGKAKEKTADPITKERYEKRGHPTDALEYFVCELCRDYIV